MGPMVQDLAVQVADQMVQDLAVLVADQIIPGLTVPVADQMTPDLAVLIARMTAAGPDLIVQPIVEAPANPHALMTAGDPGPTAQVIVLVDPTTVGAPTLHVRMTVDHARCQDPNVHTVAGRSHGQGLGVHIAAGLALVHIAEDHTAEDHTAPDHARGVPAPMEANLMLMLMLG